LSYVAEPRRGGVDRGPEDRRSEDRGQDDERRRKSLAIGISLGIAIGARIGVAMDNLGLGMGKR
jgi:hypothetical protein